MAFDVIEFANSRDLGAYEFDPETERTYFLIGNITLEGKWYRHLKVWLEIAGKPAWEAPEAEKVAEWRHNDITEVGFVYEPDPRAVKQYVAVYAAPKDVVVKVVFQKQRNGKEWKTIFVKNGKKVNGSEYTRQKFDGK